MEDLARRGAAGSNKAAQSRNDLPHAFGVQPAVCFELTTYSLSLAVFRFSECHAQVFPVAHSLHGRAQPLLIEPVQNDGGPGRSQTLCEDLSQASAGTGNEGDFTR